MEHLVDGSRSRATTPLSVWKTTILVLFCTSLSSSLASAYEITHIDVSHTSHYQELTRRNVVVMDGLHVQSLYLRQNSSNDTSSSSAPSSSPSLNTASGLPVPFDTSLGSNFTDSACPDYFDQFLSDTTFLSCLPLSMLFQNSMSFFQAVRSPTLLVKTLEASCAASLAVCSPLMSKYADQLIAQGSCQTDYNRQNPLVLQAYAGFKAYEATYQATCLKDQSTNQYCFAEATSSNNTDDLYPYYTAVGLQLPQGTRPTCSSCLRRTMDVFSGYAVQNRQPLSQTYLGCATQVNAVCGSGFASTKASDTSKVGSSSAAERRGIHGLWFASISTSLVLISQVL